MDNEQVLGTLREMLPPCVCVAAGPPLATPLTVRERESIGPADESRIREFESGRAYAKRALAMLGVENVDLTIGPSRAPLWPTDVVGSITHVFDHRLGGFFAAAVARADAVVAIGIDVERKGSLHPHTWRQFLTRRELDRISEYPADIRSAEALFLWCAKEATTKMVEQSIDPTKIEIERDAMGHNFNATFADGVGERFPKKLIGRTACSQGLFFAVAFVPRELSQQCAK